MSRLDIVKDALLSVADQVYHYGAPANTGAPFVIWAEDSERVMGANNRRGEVAQQGTVDLFTHDEADPLRESIPATLDGKCCFYKNSTQFEPDTGLIHDEWVFEV